ncbi:unnamed protein product [Linum trigynum]|uniref:Uncharacterized protein n=1 Tax=Linum trigynum TaxID=586398 RepID=A0AAV2EVA7_9ROSI
MTRFSSKSRSRVSGKTLMVGSDLKWVFYPLPIPDAVFQVEKLSPASVRKRRDLHHHEAHVQMLVPCSSTSSRVDS